MPRSPQTEQEFVEIRNRILDAARGILDSGGLEALSMRVLAARIGLSPAAIYKYFSNKDALITVLYEDARTGLEGRLVAISENEPDPVAALRTIALAYSDFALADPVAFRVLFSLNVALPPQVHTYGGEFPSAYAVARTRMAEAIASGVFAPRDVDLATQILWAAVHGALSLYVTCVDLPFSNPRHMIPHAVETVLNGMKIHGPD